ncbi:MAG: MATE family efflux transporter, partial [Burkholderiaceae bacterium]
LPALGIAGGGVALVIFYAGGGAALAWYVLSGRSTIRLRRVPLRWLSSQGILRVGAISSLNSIQTNLVIAGATALVAASAGVAGVAGFGTGARIEYLLIPLVFGVGAPLVALVGANVGAGHQARALRIALTGGALAFAATETIGVAVAIWPQHWLLLFSDDPGMVAAGSAYLRIVGPCFGFFGLGMALYFASQGAGRLFWPLAAGVLRLAIGLGGGWLALRLGAPIQALFVALGIALVAFGMTLFVAVRSGAWFR